MADARSHIEPEIETDIEHISGYNAISAILYLPVTFISSLNTNERRRDSSDERLVPNCLVRRVRLRIRSLSVFLSLSQVKLRRKGRKSKE